MQKSNDGRHAGGNTLYALFLLVAFLQSETLCFSQDNKYTFEHISLEQGLSNKEINCILQDQNGFLWFGTENGLNKYDGYQFTAFKPNPVDTNSLSDQQVNCLYQDRDGQLWIGTKEGLDKFDVSTESFRHFRNDPSKPNSLSNNHVRTIIEDHVGTLWIGTFWGGLNRFNRETQTFKHYKHDPDDPMSLSGDDVLSMYEDSRGTLWIGTCDGLNRYDREADSFAHYKNDPGNPNSLIYDCVWAMCEDTSGALWLATNRGIYKFDPTAEKFSHMKIGFVDALLQYDGDLWAAAHGLYKIDPLNEVVLSYYTTEPDSSFDLIGYNLSSLCIDSSGVLWVGSNRGVNKCDLDKNLFKHFHGASKANFYLGETIESDKLISNYTFALYKDSSDILWIGTYDGLNRLNRQTGEIKHYTDEFGNRWKKYNNSDSTYGAMAVEAIFEDRSGNLWIGTDMFGLQKFDRKTETCTPYRLVDGNPRSNSENVRAIYQDYDGMLWVGMFGDGLCKLDIEKNKWTRYYHPQFETYLPRVFMSIDSLKSDQRTIASILQVGDNENQSVDFNIQEETNALIIVAGEIMNDPDDYGWLENRQGLIWQMDKVSTRHAGGVDKNRIQIATLRLQPGDYTLKYTSDESHAFGQWNAHPPSNPEFWGIQLLRLTGTETAWFEEELQEKYIPDRQSNDLSSLPGYIYSIIGALDSTLWIGTNHGLYHYNQKTDVVTQYNHKKGNPNSLCNRYVNALCEDKSGMLWIGTNNGLNRYDRESNKFTYYNEKHGLPNNTILGILADDGGRLWLSTQNGVCRFDPETELCRNYEISDGVQGRIFHRGASFKSKDGEMFFGGENGFNSFYPNELQDNANPPKIVFTDFKLFNESVKIAGKRSPLQKHISETDTIVLSYNQDVISFDFVALHYTNPAKIQYAYQMAGYDKDWNYCGTRRYANYTNLSPGTYSFRVKAANSDGVWNENDASVQLIISPPFWRTWWFSIIAIFSLFTLAYIGYKRRLKNVRLKTELAAAHNAQMSIMPHSDPQVPGFDISGTCIPANEVGGDFFDYIWLNEQETNLGIVVGDVSGKAMSSAMTAVMSSGMIYSNAYNGRSIKEIMTRVNRPMYLKTNRNMFTALCFAAIDLETKELAFTNAGLNDPLLISEGTVNWVDGVGPKFPLGGVKETIYDEKKILLKSNDVLILFTDGISEAQNHSRKMYGEESLKAFVEKLDTTDLSAKEIKESIIKDVKNFSGSARQYDDMTVVVLRAV